MLGKYESTITYNLEDIMVEISELQMDLGLIKDSMKATLKKLYKIKEQAHGYSFTGTSMAKGLPTISV
jgi:hypothetical protein